VISQSYLSAIKAWLRPSVSEAGRYRHVVLAEQPAARSAGLKALRQIVKEAHADAARRLDDLGAPTLDPLVSPSKSQALGYPEALHTITLQGYLGEIIGAIIAETYSPHEREWTVPCFPFRHHTAAFQALERRRQLGGRARRTPGRTGDDFLAFVRDSDGTILAWLMGEAKCTASHDAGLIGDGHAQLSIGLAIPVDLLQLIDVLESVGDSESLGWAASLRRLNAADLDSAPERYDAFVYVCGRSPVKKKTWMSTGSPHERYTRDGPLEAAEVHMPDVDGALKSVYAAHVIGR
jgi:hypothetical protein